MPPRPGSAFIDRALYLPRSWTSDPARCQAAGIPEGTGFATKPALAQEMIGRAPDAGTPAGWVAADEVYGQDPQLRAELARRGLGYVLAIRKSDPVLTPAGPLPAGELARRLPARAWQRLSAGPGAKGPRWYDWALIEASDPAVTEGEGPHWLLIRRRISDGELAFYRAHAPRSVPLAQLVHVAGSRWKVEVGHYWYRSSRAAFSWLCSLLVAGLVFWLCPAGAGVVAGRACPALA
jgi:SRSO17 transposase